jgi:hypothetical protein
MFLAAELDLRRQVDLLVVRLELRAAREELGEVRVGVLGTTVQRRAAELVGDDVASGAEDAEQPLAIVGPKDRGQAVGDRL